MVYVYTARSRDEARRQPARVLECLASGSGRVPAHALNGYRLDASEAEAVRLTLGLSTREIDEKGFAQWLRDSSVRLPHR